MEFSIDAINEDDFEELNILFREFADFENVADKMTNTLMQMKQEKEFIRGFTAKNNNGDTIGYATYFFSYHTFVGKCLYMDDLYIRPVYRGNGLGTLLINRIIAFAKEQKCNCLRWQVSNWNERAITFYEKLGGKIDRTEMNVNLLLNR